MTATNQIESKLSPLTAQQLRQLMSPLSSLRVKKLKNLSYLEAWDVKATLIRMFGYGGFSADLIESDIIRAEQVPQANNAQKMNWAVTAKAVVRIHIHQTGATYTEAAVAGSKQPDFTESADMALKSAESDALKRAAIYLGTQFGLSLYDDGTTNDVVRNILDPVQDATIREAVAEQQREREKQQAMQAQQPILVEQQPQQMQAAPQQYMRSEGVTPEQHADNLALVERAMGMKAQQEAAAAN